MRDDGLSRRRLAIKNSARAVAKNHLADISHHALPSAVRWM